MPDDAVAVSGANSCSFSALPLSESGQVDDTRSEHRLTMTHRRTPTDRTEEKNMTDSASTTAVTVDPSGPVAGLRVSSADVWDAAVDHRFVRELFAGVIDDRVLADYLVQDYQFFDTFLSMLGACVAYADDVPAKLRFAQQLGMLASDEDGYFQRAFDDLDVVELRRTAPELTATTVAFRAVMTEATTSRSYPQLLVVLVVAEWLYLEWGEREAPMPPLDLHAGWIELHRGASFRAWVQFLVDELNRAFPAHDPLETEHLTATWRRVVDLELEFFDTCYR
jgi:thiaminase/transcriptional activator TenA